MMWATTSMKMALRRSRSAEGIRRRYNRERAVNTRLDGGSAVDAVAENLPMGAAAPTEPTAAVPTPLPKIIGLLSSLFDPFMGPYIGMERKNMEDMIRSISGGASRSRWRLARVYVVRTDVRVYKGSVKRCTALTAGHFLISTRNSKLAFLSTGLF